MSNSILTSTKKILGIDESYTAFDLDILTHINSALMIVNQLGLGSEDGSEITGPEETWDDLFGTDPMLNTIRTYVYLRVRVLFDPPATSFHLKALEDQLREMEWRISVYREGNDWVDPTASVA